jgi:hypothetical protein
MHAMYLGSITLVLVQILIKIITKTMEQRKCGFLSKKIMYATKRIYVHTVRIYLMSTCKDWRGR